MQHQPRSPLPVKAPPGFSRMTGVPNTPHSKSFFSDAATAVARATGDPLCVGISAQRLFYGPVGHPRIVPGRVGEDACFIRDGAGV